MLRSIPNRIHTRIDVDSDKAQGAFRAMVAGIDSSMNSWNALATRIRTIGTVISNMIKGSLISNITLVVPIIASMVPALFAVLNAIGVVAGGAAGLAAAFGVAAGGVMGFGVMAASAIKMLNDGTLQATAETKKYESALQGVQDAWQGIIEKNQSQIFNTMANGLNMIKVALAGLSPFISGVSKGMEQASAKMLDWAKNSQVAQKFFQMMGTTGVRIFNNMLSAAGNFGSGVVSVLTQLAPLADWAAAGFKQMGQAFNSWAQSSAGQEAIRSFVEYTKQNLPLIGQIFGNTFKGIFNLMKAFAPNTHSILESLAQMSEKFASWSATIAQSDGFKKFMDYINTNGPKLITLLGNIIKIIINVGTAMAPLAAAVLDVAIAITDFIAKLTEAHPAIGILLGLIATLAGVFMTLGPPILGAIDFIGTFVKALTGAGTVIEALSAIGSALSGALDTVALAFMYLDAPIIAIVAAVAAVIAIFVALWNSSEVLRNAVTNAWNAISSAVGNAIHAVIGFLQDLWNEAQSILAPLVPIFKNTWDIIVKVVETAVKLLTPMVSQAFNTMVNVIKVAWEVIKAVVKIAMEFILGTITALLQLLAGDWSGAWETISKVGADIWQAIVDMAKNIWQILGGLFTTNMAKYCEWLFSNIWTINQSG